MRHNRRYALALIFGMLLLGSCKTKERAEHYSINEDAEQQPIVIDIKDPPRSQRSPPPITDIPLAGANPLIPAPGLAGGFFPIPVPPPLPISDDSEDISSDDDESECHQSCDLGNAGFNTVSPDDWLIIDTPSYPNTVLLSQDRVYGFTKGALSLTPTGIRVNKAGDYWATFSAIMLNQNQEYTPLIPTFLIRNGTFIPNDTMFSLAAVGALPPGVITTLQGNGLLIDVESGTDLSIVATNGGSPEPEPITVLAWSISLYKICD